LRDGQRLTVIQAGTAWFTRMAHAIRLRRLETQAPFN
jgi:hypothetical protein